MPSRRLAVALAAVVLLSGCSMLPGGGGGGEQTTTVDPPDHHEFVFGSYTGGEPFNATVTVEKDGSVLHEQTVAGDGNGTYTELVTLEKPGPYTVTVNTTLPGVGGGTRNRQFTADGTLGNGTAIRVAYLGIYDRSFRLPRRHLEYPLGVYSSYLNDTGPNDVDVDVRLEYRGELVASKTKTVRSDELTKVFGLNRTGVYHVAARGESDEWTNRTVVVTNPENYIKVSLNARGKVDELKVNPPWGWRLN
jgi:hypothetical protein